MAASYYDYSQLRANGVTPSAVYANGQPVYRLLANGVDIIHKRAGYTMNYRFGFQFTINVVVSTHDRWVVDYWNCGTEEGHYELDHYETELWLSPVKDIRESNGDGYISNVGWYHENYIHFDAYGKNGRCYPSGGRARVGYYEWFNMGEVNDFDHVTITVNKDVCNVRWSLDRPEVNYNLNASGNFNSKGTYEIWGGWVSRSKTVQEY